MLKLSALAFLLFLEVSWAVSPPAPAMSGGGFSGWPGHSPTIPEEDERADNETSLEENKPDYVLQKQDLDANSVGGEIGDVLERYRVHTRALPWFDALTKCWREGGHLATPENDTEARQLGHLLKAAIDTGKVTNTLMTDAMHIGIHNIRKDSSWRTPAGRGVAYSSWAPNSSPFSNGGDMKGGAILANGRYVYQTLQEKLIYACDMKPKPTTETEETISNEDQGKYKRLVGPKLYRLDLTPLTWLDALETCTKEGASLAQPANGREAGLLAGLLSSRSDVPSEVRRGGIFIGISDVVDEGSWKDIEGNYMYVDNWAVGRPNGSRAANCAAMPFNGVYVDVSCGQPRAFLCEKKRPTENPTYVQLEGGGFGRYALHTAPRTWMEAVMKCRAENATLAVPESKEEAAAITKMTEKALEERELPLDVEAIHVGVHDLDGDKRWTTTEGKRMIKSGFNEWAENSQNMYQNYCACLKYGKFENRQCSTEAMFYCKIA